MLGGDFELSSDGFVGYQQVYYSDNDDIVVIFDWEYRFNAIVLGFTADINGARALMSMAEVQEIFGEGKFWVTGDVLPHTYFLLYDYGEFIHRNDLHTK